MAARPLLSGNGAQGFVRTGGAGVSAHCAVATAAAPAAPLSSRPCGGEGYEEVLSKVEKQLGSFASTPMVLRQRNKERNCWWGVLFLILG